MSESKSKKATRNIIFSIVQNLANIGITLVSRVVFVRALDASYLGINGLFSNIFGLLSMADLGMATAMMYPFYCSFKYSRVKSEVPVTLNTGFHVIGSRQSDISSIGHYVGETP